MTMLSLHIAGAENAASDAATTPVHSPWDHRHLFDVAHATAQDVDRAVAAAATAFRDGRWWRQRARERARVLTKAAELLADAVEELAELETAQTGRPVREMRSQLARLPEWFEYFGALAQVDEGRLPDLGAGRINLVRRRPLGVAALITPWNHPLLITVKKLSAAVAAGNSVVLKPSELAPAGPLRLVRLLEEAGVPAGVVNVVTGLGQTTGKALVEHPLVDRIDVTGGTPTGRVVAAIAGDRLIPVTAELGGKAPVIVLPDADLDQAVAGALFASYIATGQTCVQGARILVHESIRAEFEERFATRARALRLGDPADRRTQVGPLISQRQREQTVEAVTRAVAHDARLVCGGRIPDVPGHGWFYEPTLLADVTPEMDIWTEEVFGPVSVLRTFTTDAEAAEQANDSPFGLAASIWTSDAARALRLVDELDIGIVWVNDHHRVDPASPWGGTKDSGIGSENAREALIANTRVQSTIVNVDDDLFDWFSTTSDLRYS